MFPRLKKLWPYLCLLFINNFLLLSTKVLGKSLFLIEADVGYSSLEYEEIRTGQNSLDTIFSQTGLRFRGRAEYMFWPGLMYVGTSIDHGTPISTSVDQTSSNDPGGCCEITSTDMKSYFGLFIPGARPINLTLLAEFSSSDIETTSSAYGHSTASGMQYGFSADITSNGGTSLYAKWFPWKDVSNREEVQLGLSFNLSPKSSSYPESLFLEGLIFKVDYRQITLNFDGDNRVKIDRKEVTASLGLEILIICPIHNRFIFVCCTCIGICLIPTSNGDS